MFSSVGAIQNIGRMTSFLLLVCVSLVFPKRPSAQRFRRFVDTAEQTEQTLLDAAKLKFNSVNNGYYEYQVQRSCFCDICDIQAMNVYVENNAAVHAQFAESDDYALNRFCSGDQDVLQNRLQSSKQSIDDLFDLIQTALNNEENVAVLYHDRIGIPLSASVDPSADIADDEWFISVNCIQFADIAIDAEPTTTLRRVRRNRRAQVTPASFNSNNSYSCANVEVPAQCSADAAFFSCHRYSDGCNTCSCDDFGNGVGCTKRVCPEGLARQPLCMDCESNTEWTECGANGECVPDCQSNDNFCGLAVTTECSPARCQCPLSRPRWNGQECVTESECGIISPSPPTFPPETTSTQPPATTSTSQSIEPEVTPPGPGDFTIDSEPEPISPFCVSHCAKYSDGCVTCNCDVDGFQDADCVANQALIAAAGGCFPGAFAHRTCLQCQDPERMTYTQCGRADDITCDTLNAAPQFTDITQCVEKCQCNDAFPIYDAVIGRCLSADFCAHEDAPPPLMDTGRCIEHCPVYFNGCNACQCPDIVPSSIDNGADFCTNLKCETGVEGGPRRTCFRCELSTMEYTQCGKCDRTCLDPAPRCLNGNACKEKCQCPLEAPIFHDGACIPLEQCPLLNAGTLDDVNLRLDPNDLFSAPAAARHGTAQQSVALNSDDGATARQSIEWDEHALFSVVAAICVMSGAMLLFWPWWSKKQRKRRDMLALPHDANDADDEQEEDAHDEYDDGEDDYNYQMVSMAVTTERSELRYAPDGSIIDMYS